MATFDMALTRAHPKLPGHDYTRRVLFDSIARIHHKLALPVSLMLRRVPPRPVKLGGLADHRIQWALFPHHDYLVTCPEIP
ncbi:hypothetical protein GGQ85_000186 [Nitrobacter vulgaris]|nr:hypothetical protein [Nitrobacter vulgaris]